MSVTSVTSATNAMSATPCNSASLPSESLAAPLSDCRDLARAITAALDQLDRVVRSLDASQYCSISCDPAFGASIGRHVRHILDHIGAIQSAATSAPVADYESRARDAQIERDPELALVEIARLREAVASMSDVDPARPAMILIAVTRGQPKVTLPSTIGRELSFILSHTVHHHAIIRTMLCGLGLSASIDPEFGLAPGTPTCAANSCAR